VSMSESVPADEEFHGKVSDSSEKRLESPAVTPESVNAKLIVEGEQLLKSQNTESVTKRNGLQKLRDKLREVLRI